MEINDKLDFQIIEFIRKFLVEGIIKYMILDDIMGQLELQLNSIFLRRGGAKLALIEYEIKIAYERCIKALSAYKDKYLNPNGQPVFSLYHSGCWSIFLYYLSNTLSDEKEEWAQKICYLNKILHSVDWYYKIGLPDHFMVTHPMGCALGRALYGDYLAIYQRVTIGANISLSDGELYYPKLGSGVTLFPDAKVLGNSTIGNNVILSVGSCVINENIPDNSIVFGCSPNLVIKEDASKVKTLLERNWRQYEKT